MLAYLGGKTVLVTGAGSSIGIGIAMPMAAQNASVAVTDLSEEWVADVTVDI